MRRISLDPFTIVALLFLGVCAYIVYSVYFQNHVTIFTTDEQIEESKSVEFGFFAQYL